MQPRLFANISTLVLSDTLSGGSYSFPRGTAGQDVAIALLLSRKIDEGNERIFDRNVHSAKVSLGKPDARPERGTWQIRLGAGSPVLGENMTTKLAFDATADQVKAALDALTASGLSSLLPCDSVRLEGGSYIVTLKNGGNTTFTCEDNELWPMSFVNVSSYEFDEAWQHEIRLTQTPVAQSTVFDLRASSPPVIARVREGATTSGVQTNEIQRLTIPSDFTGFFELRRGHKKTSAIGLPTDATEIAEAIKALADDEGEFIVTAGQDEVMIEFTGSMAGTSQNLLVVQVLHSPGRSVDLLLPTNTAAMHNLLKYPATDGTVTLQLEITLELEKLEVEDEYESITWRAETKWQAPVNTEARNIAADLDWLQPPSRTDFLQHSADLILVGHRNYEAAFGNGSATSFVFNHNLDGTSFHVSVRENSSGGLRLQDSAYTVAFTNSNSLTITLPSAPSSNSLVVAITSIAHSAAFEDHTHTIDEITGLDARLDAIEQALDALETLAPSGSLTGSTTTSSTTPIVLWPLPPIVDLYPSRWSAYVLPDGATEQVVPTRISDITPAVLAGLQIRDGGLLPAVHRSAFISFPGSGDIDFADASTYKGNVIKNGRSTDITIPGGKGRRGAVLKPGEFASFDGRVWYKIAQPEGSVAYSGFVKNYNDMASDEVTVLGGYYRHSGNLVYKALVAEEKGTIGAPPGDGSKWELFGSYTLLSASWYPVDFERKLFELAINSKQLRLKKGFYANFGFEAGILTNRSAYPDRATNSPLQTSAQWELRIEWGEFKGLDFPTDSESTNPDHAIRANLSDIDWKVATPLLAHKIHLTTAPVVHTFGVEVLRSAANAITANVILYGGKEAVSLSGAVPSTANFAIRARLCRFDTEDDVSDPRGLVALIGLARDVVVSETASTTEVLTAGDMGVAYIR